ncbi:MAG: DUF2059 domain-containing protein [Devosia sp.]|nr:DUF2059 domain-containing protein [Devosia sp.]
MTGNKPMTFSTKRVPALLAAVMALILSAFAALPAVSQEITPEHLALARKYIDLTDHSGIYEATIVQAGINTYRQLLPQNPEIAGPLNTAIETVISVYKGRKGELFDQMARVYALTFAPEEMQQIVSFYESPVGQKLSKANAELNSTIQRVMNVFSVNLNTEFFAKVRAELKAKGIDT